MADPFEDALKATAKALERTLDGMLPVPTSGERRVVEAMRYALFAGGKRIRPFLVLASADLFGVDRQAALRVAAAIECVHTYSLVHDDLPAMDDDDLRRGKPTVHKAFDEATAILAGDALLTLAFEILADEATHADPRVRSELVLCLARASGHHGMVGGQMIDLTAADQDMDEAQVARLQQLKTGALLVFSAEAGAILGKASSHNRHCLVGYARALGLAFQIVDDLLDIEGTPEEIGKQTGKDEVAGKATMVSFMGVEAARSHAEMLANQANEYVAEFGDKAALLSAAAHFIVHRRH